MNPFPGLRPFQEEEENLFFGREHQVDAMVDRLAAARFLAVVGTSGSGKSSLVNCGLRPALHRGWMAAAGSSWRVAQFRPSGEPIQSLISTLSQDGLLFTNHHGPIALDEIVDTHLRLSKRGLIDLFRKARLPNGTNLLIVVDQFEELFRYARLGAAAEAIALVNLLLEVRQEALCPIYVVLTMRSDFLGDCAQFHGLPEAINAGQYLVPRLTRDERREAIAGPIRVAGAKIDPALLTRVVNDVGENPDQLSILQHALNRTWANWAHEGQGIGPLAIQHYEAIGTMEGALDRHAEKAYADLGTGRNQQICGKMFRALTDKGMDARGVRRPTTFQELCALAEATPAEMSGVIDVFRKPSRAFLMPPLPVEHEPHSIIDISHESLMRVWKRLNQWVEEEADSASQYRRLAESAALHAKDEAGLITDPELALMLAWRERNRPIAVWAERYHPGFAEAQSFLEESRKVRDDALAWRKKKRLIWAGLAALGAIGLIFFSLKGARDAQERERAARVHDALSASDPLIGALALPELGFAAASKESIMALRQAASAAIPLSVLGNREPQRPNSRLLSAWFEPDDKQVVTVSTLGEFQRWPTDGKGNPNTLLPAKMGELATVAVSRDRLWIAAALNGEGGGWIARADGAEPMERFGRDGPKITALAFTPDGQRIVAGYPDSHIRIWKRNGELLKDLYKLDPLHNGTISAIQVDSLGQMALGASWDKTIRIWDLRTGVPGPLFGGGEFEVFAAALSPNGLWVACGYDDGSAEILRSDGKGRARPLEGHAKPVTSVAFSPDGSKVVTGSEDQTARLSNVQMKVELQERSLAIHSTTLFRGHTGAVRAVAFSNDGSRIVTASDDGTARVWYSESQEPRVVRKHESTVQSVAFSPDGKSVLSASDDRTAQVGKLEGSADTLVFHASSYVRSAAFDSTGKQVVAGAEDGVLAIWDLVTNNKQLQSDLGQTLSVAFTPDGKGIVTGGRDNMARVWSTDASRRGPVVTLKGHANWVYSASFSPDRTHIVTTSGDRTARIWPITWDSGTIHLQGEPTVFQHQDRVMKAAFSPDGFSIATACSDGHARVWKIENNQYPSKVFPYTGDVFSVAFSSDGKWLLTASNDKTAQIWDVATGAQYVVLPHGLAGVRSAVFGPGDASVLTGAEDGLVRLWHIAPRALVDYMGHASSACLTPGERVRFLGDTEESSRTAYARCEASFGRASAQFIATPTK